MAASIFLKSLTLKCDILRTIWRIEVSDGSLFCIFNALSFQLNLFFDRTCPLISGLKEGFHLGCTGPHFAITPKNLKSTWDNAAQVTEAIVKELSRGHIRLLSRGLTRLP